MKKVLLGGVALITLGFVGAAGAADLPVKAPAPVVVNTWTGFYVGGDIGGIDGANSNFTFAQGPGFGGGGNVVYDPVGLSSNNSWGLVGGVYGGYNWAVTPSWVVGVEGDWSKASLGNTNSDQRLTSGGGGIPPGCSVTGVATCNTALLSDNVNWLATVRGRLGYSIGSLLIYGTAGGAWASIEHSGQVAPVQANVGSIAVSSSSTSSGWVAGGGVEFMATANWLLRVEYLHYDLSSGTTLTGACVKCIAGNFSGPGVFGYGGASFDSVRAGLAYKF